jgi:hypothetical protein
VKIENSPRKATIDRPQSSAWRHRRKSRGKGDDRGGMVATFDGDEAEVRIPSSTKNAARQLLRLLQGEQGEAGRRGGWIGGRADAENGTGRGGKEKKRT